MSSSFSDLGVPADVVASLATRGISEAFPIQSMAIPPALEGRDVLRSRPRPARGKTLAFGIPLAERVAAARAARPRALILAPTRELAAQIHDELRPLLALRKRSVASFYGGVGFDPQLKVLRRGVDVAVACPGRLADLVQRGNLILDEVEIVVIDEADRMADMGFLPEVQRILDAVRPDRQTLLFSATLDRDVDVLIRRYQRDPERLEVTADAAEVDRTTHHFVRRQARGPRRPHRRPREDARIARGLLPHQARHRSRGRSSSQRAGVHAVPIHGGRSQSQRDRALASFIAGKAHALVATDVAARGMHVDNVGCVVHFDVARDHKDYVHRSGRTGRAGADGVVVSFVTDDDVAKVRQLQKALGMSVAADAPRRPTGGERPSRPPWNGGRNGSRPRGANGRRRQSR